MSEDGNLSFSHLLTRSLFPYISPPSISLLLHIQTHFSLSPSLSLSLSVFLSLSLAISPALQAAAPPCHCHNATNVRQSNTPHECTNTHTHTGAVDDGKHVRVTARRPASPRLTQHHQLLAFRTSNGGRKTGRFGYERRTALTRPHPLRKTKTSSLTPSPQFANSQYSHYSSWILFRAATCPSASVRGAGGVEGR